MVFKVRTNGEREGTPSKAFRLHMNVNNYSMSQQEFLRYTKLLGKIHCAEKDTHVTAGTEDGHGHISMHFFQGLFLGHLSPYPKEGDAH